MALAANDMEAPCAPAMPAVAIVDADSSARNSTRCLLESEDYRVRAFPSVNALLGASPAWTPDCILLDLQVPGRDGLDMLRQLTERGDCPPILIVSAQAQLDVAVAAMKLGASDFVQKPYVPDELLSAIRDLAPAAGPREPAIARGDEISSKVHALSARQRQILAGIVRGLQNKTIAWELQLSVRTVEDYRANMFRRLGIKSVADAVRIGVAAGLEPR